MLQSIGALRHTMLEHRRPADIRPEDEIVVRLLDPVTAIPHAATGEWYQSLIIKARLPPRLRDHPGFTQSTRT
jgi:hypothetical protein